MATQRLWKTLKHRLWSTASCISPGSRGASEYSKPQGAGLVLTFPSHGRAVEQIHSVPIGYFPHFWVKHFSRSLNVLDMFCVFRTCFFTHSTCCVWGGSRVQTPIWPCIGRVVGGPGTQLQLLRFQVHAVYCSFKLACLACAVKHCLGGDWDKLPRESDFAKPSFK